MTSNISHIRKFYFSAVCALVIFTAGCSKTNSQNTVQDQDKLNVVTTLFPYYDFTRNIGGDNINVTMLLPAGMESHSFEPTPEDIITLQHADVIIYNGGNMEAWMSDVLSSINVSDKEVVCMMDFVDVVEEEHVEGMQAEHEEDEHGRLADVEYDEHIWTSPYNAIAISEKICEVLSHADSPNTESYEIRKDNYVKELSALDDKFKDVVAKGKRKVFVFGDRFPLRYFADRYGLEYRAAFAGCSTDTEPSVATIAYLIDYINDNDIPVVYYLELSSHKVADVICESTSAKAMLFHSCHNVTQKELDSGITYVGIMQDNVERLREGLN